MLLFHTYLRKNILPTFKSLKGCIKTPKGNLDFCSKEFDTGIFVSVQRNILKKKKISQNH